MLPPPPIMYDSHMHTPLCKHAKGYPQEYARHALSRGLRGITITDHNPLPDGMSPGVRMDQAEYPIYLEMVEATREEFEGRLDVRVGLECDWLPGLEPFLEGQISSSPLSYVLGSVHCQIHEYVRSFANGSAFDFQMQYFTHLAEAAETGLFDCLSHPDLVKNSTAKQWDIEKILPHIQLCLDRIAKTGIAMELNTSGLLKRIKEFNPGPEILGEILKREIPIVVSSDAHDPWRVADQFEQAYDQLKELGFTQVSYFLDRYRVDVPIEEARASLIPPL